MRAYQIKHIGRHHTSDTGGGDVEPQTGVSQLGRIDFAAVRVGHVDHGSQCQFAY